MEDNESDVYLIREALESIGISIAIQVARDGEQAVYMLDELEASADAPCPSLVVLDINLPKLQGSEVLKHLRQLSKCAGTRVLIVSTSDSLTERQTMIDLGANGYFRKPSQYDQFMKLGDVVKTLLAPRAGAE